MSKKKDMPGALPTPTWHTFVQLTGREIFILFQRVRTCEHQNMGAEDKILSI
jgi:hypothetical protein